MKEVQSNSNNKEKELRNQLKYVNQLLKLDSVIYVNKTYINNNLIKHYDIPKLLLERDMLITNIKNKEVRKRNIIVLLTLLLFVVTFGFWYQFDHTKHNDAINCSKAR